MIKRIFTSFLLIIVCFFVGAQDKIPMRYMKINKSLSFKNGNYLLSPAAGRKEAIIIIEGNNIVIDFKNASINGSVTGNLPDQFTATFILIRNSKNVTIKNCKARGYKIGIRAENVVQLSLENCDLSYNYRPRLNSSQEKEDVSDWMSYHHNEKDEWLRYGAGIYLRDCNKAKVINCTVTGGQNALMITNCNDGMFVNNDFSFNSGIGLGMYRSSRNVIAHNRINFNVRGYSHGVYNRGQDSAGMLMYEQSNNNIVFENSVTHGGDGFFLWAGQSTMDSGEGGCNDNVVTRNDFSYAPTNGIEATFSRNSFTGNRVFECDHGMWGGYSYNTVISDNQFRNNRVGIAIEHGQENQISYNVFAGNKTAIKLWGEPETASDWGYPKHRDTRSQRYTIVSNSFNNDQLVFDLSKTSRLNIFGNTVSGEQQLYKLDSFVTDLDTTIDEEIKTRLEVDTGAVTPDIPPGFDPFRGNGKFAGRKNIMMTEWGPYDFRYPLIWQSNPTEQSDTIRVNILGPSGYWKVKSVKGLHELNRRQGQFPSTITALRDEGPVTDIELELVYTGPAFTSMMGEKVAANKPYSFRFRKYFQPMEWITRFFSLDTASHNPIRTGSLFSPVERKAPLKTDTVSKLDYAWWGGIKAMGQQFSQFITIAETTASFQPGWYELSITWDDAVRIYDGDKLIFNAWDPSKYNFDETPNKKLKLQLAGKHQFRVEHLELGGFAALSLKFRRL